MSYKSVYLYATEAKKEKVSDAHLAHENFFEALKLSAAMFERSSEDSTNFLMALEISFELSGSK